MRRWTMAVVLALGVTAAATSQAAEPPADGGPAPSAEPAASQPPLGRYCVERKNEVLGCFTERVQCEELRVRMDATGMTGHRCQSRGQVACYTFNAGPSFNGGNDVESCWPTMARCEGLLDVKKRGTKDTIKKPCALQGTPAADEPPPAPYGNAAPPPPVEPDPRGCGCDVPGVASSGGVAEIAFGAFVASVVAGAHRRRRRSARR